MAKLETAEILQRPENLNKQNLRHRLAAVGQGKLRMGNRVPTLIKRR